MPSLTVYVPEEVYILLSKRSNGNAIKLAKEWLMERYRMEAEKEGGKTGWNV